MRNTGKLALCSAIAVVLLLSVGVLTRTQIHHWARPQGTHSISLLGRAEHRNRSGNRERKVYPFSVVPGGVYSAEDLARSRRIDAVVAKHYAGFGNSITVQKTVRDTYMYVSYRKEDQVYWTRTKHKIARGEYVLTDGNQFARARCGNRLSVTPQQPVMDADEPGEQRLDTPEPAGDNYLADLKPPESETLYSVLPSSDGQPAPDTPAGTSKPAGVSGAAAGTTSDDIPFQPGRAFGGGPWYSQPNNSAPVAAITQAGGNSPPRTEGAPLPSAPVNFNVGPDPLPVDPGSFASVPTPEPGSLLLLVCGLGLVGWVARSRKAGV